MKVSSLEGTTDPEDPTDKISDRPCTLRASASRPWIASQRGDSGMTNTTATTNAPGTIAPKPIITRQLPAQLGQINEMTSATTKPRVCPTAIVNSEKVTK